MRRSILHNIAIVSVLLFSVVTAAQPTKTDKVIDLEEVVVSGQIEPQSVKKSVKNVQVITKEQIKGVGATHLGEVLNQYVNLNILPDEGSGKQKISLYGLGANYFKVFVDNVPLVSEDGLGVNTDLSQINVDDIERIEIVEGAMGVTHGANAVTGIMNIITKKKATNKWDITYSLQEETLSREYPQLDIHPIRKVSAAEGQILHKIKGLMGVVCIVILLLSSLCVNTSLTAMTHERRREFALQSALGASRKAITAQMIRETALMAAVAVVLGIALGLILAQILGAVVFHASIAPRLPVFPLVIILSVAVAAAAVALPLKRVLALQASDILKGA